MLQPDLYEKAMPRPQSLPPGAPGPVEPGFADLPPFLSVAGPHEAIESDPQARLEASAQLPGALASERLPPGRVTRPGEH
ncbi:hypothetical protein ACFFGH_08850 [Lysobacter korlensis]|uniref:Uncharacterized protein n=1 Tax=Lysobacter korlensis TaxID=553636 RepID=A0ABV6RLT2_9GAMM